MPEHEPRSRKAPRHEPRLNFLCAVIIVACYNQTVNREERTVNENL